jgi:hypothetical protein
MIVLKITKDQIEEAKKLYTFDALNGSIMGGSSNIFGAIGEVVVADYFRSKGRNVDFNSTYDYDLKIDNMKVDVKTKRTTAVPESHFNCSIPSFNTRQKCDYYFFCRVHESLEYCYLLGYKSKESFFSEATFNKKGEPDGKWKFKSDCYNLEIKKLNKFTT